MPREAGRRLGQAARAHTAAAGYQPGRGESESPQGFEGFGNPVAEVTSNNAAMLNSPTAAPLKPNGAAHIQICRLPRLRWLPSVRRRLPFQLPTKRCGACKLGAQGNVDEP